MDTPTTWLKDVELFTPDGRRRGDCLVKNGRIAQLGDVNGSGADEVVEGNGRWLFPGIIDAHVHFRTPGLTHKEDWTTASAAAVAGGVTTAFDMPNVDPATITPDALADKREIVGEQTRCNYGFFYGATADNTDSYDTVDGVCALKIFMAMSTGNLLVDKEEDLRRVFGAWDGQISVHAENQARLDARREEFKDRTDTAAHSEIRDPKAAADAIRLAGELAIEFGRQVHVLHTSTGAEMEALAEVREAADQADTDARITAEVCPHHLVMSTEMYEDWGNYAKVNPPVRPPEEQARMWQALHDGDVQMMATDHAPHRPEEKEQPYWEAPSGMPGVQTLLPVMLDAAHRDKCSPEQVVEWLCHGPTEVYDIADRGRLEENNWADLTLIDPEMTREVTDADQFSRCGWTPLRGRTLTGWPTETWVNGRLAYRREDKGQGVVRADEGTGREVDFR